MLDGDALDLQSFTARLTLTAADGVLIPVQCEYYALEGLTALMNTIKLIKQDLNPELQIEGVLLTSPSAREAGLLFNFGPHPKFTRKAYDNANKPNLKR